MRVHILAILLSMMCVFDEAPIQDPLYDNFEYLAACVEAEAGNQGLYGKQLVACVILNRVDSSDFPDTVVEVINQSDNGQYQFAVVKNGSIHDVEVTEESRQAVRMEIESRTNTEILYFRTKHYHTFGTPVLSYKDHYFSK